MNPDTIIKITFPVDGKPEDIKIYTNAKPEAVGEILNAWLSNQIGQGEDSAPFKELKSYEIIIGLEVANNTFGTRSNTGNKSLTCGLVMHTAAHLKHITISPL